MISPGLSCGAYLEPFLQSPSNVGQLLNPNATSDCEYCRYSQGDAYLATLNMYWSQRWRNFGIFMSYVSHLLILIRRYVIFNFFAIFFLFYISRIAKLDKKKSTKKTLLKSAKESALNIGHAVESLLIRKDDGANEKKADTSLNSAHFAIFQGTGLETFDSRGLGREWTRRDQTAD